MNGRKKTLRSRYKCVNRIFLKAYFKFFAGQGGFTMVCFFYIQKKKNMKAYFTDINVAQMTDTRN